MSIEEFINECTILNIKIDEKIINDLSIYQKELVIWNKKFNLTTILEKEDVFLKHFFDSLTIMKTNKLKDNTSLCDFGTGAGFPGMVIAIVYEKINVTLIESNKKKCEFLSNIKNKLDLKNVKIINERMEDYSKKNKEIFDIITCRAVSSLGIIIELAAPSIKINGYFIALKSKYEEEIKKINSIINDLGLKLNKIINFNLPKENSERNILIYEKIKKTSEKYPRNYNTIVKSYK